MIIKPPSHPGRPPRERGVSLLFALLALVALSLASVALVRSVDTSALVMGNLGFKQDATSAADKAAQVAITTVFPSASTFDHNSDKATDGYYAMAHESIDVTGQQTSNLTRELVDWDGDGCAYATNTSLATCVLRPSAEQVYNGNKLRYVVFRLCSATGDPSAAGTVCARPKTVTSGAGAGGSGTATPASKRGEFKYGGSRINPDPATPGSSYQGVYYRVVVRVIGARNTTSFVETIVHQ